VELRVHPHAVKITGVDDPRSGLMSKFSINHSASVAYLDGNAGVAQYTDARAGAADVLAFRPKINVSVVEEFRKDQAHATLIATDGRRFEAPVAHASGTVDNPMSDAALERKFLGNAVGALGEDRARAIAQAVWTLDGMADVRDLLALCA
jgi:2-methylcitrate dehydratase PrpD